MTGHRRFRDLVDETHHPYSRAHRDEPHWWCECESPMPMPCTIFGSAMGGYQECQRCGRPVIGSERTNPYGTLPPASAVFALVTEQRLAFAIVGLVFVCVFVVWPVVRPRPHRPSEYESMRMHRRLMREIRRHQ